MKLIDLIDDNSLAHIARLVKKPLRKVQGDAVKALAVEADAHGITDLWQFAYILGTCWHESFFTPQVEKRARRGTTVWEMQERYWHSGFYGRGLIQLTHERNYRKFSKIRGIDFVVNPDAVMQLSESAFIAVHGMQNGLFTGARLSMVNIHKLVTCLPCLEEMLARPQFPFFTRSGKVRNKAVKPPAPSVELNAAHVLYYARTIVNGTFHATQVAVATVKMYRALYEAKARLEVPV